MPQNWVFLLLLSQKLYSTRLIKDKSIKNEKKTDRRRIEMKNKERFR